MPGTLTGTYPRYDGTAARGRVILEAVDASTGKPVRVIVDATGNKVYSGPSVDVPLDDAGHFTISLPASDDPDLNPTGFAWRVRAQLHHAHLDPVTLTLLDGETLDVADATDPDPVAPTYAERVSEATEAAAEATAAAGTAAGHATTASTAAATAATSATTAATAATGAAASATAADTAADTAAAWVADVTVGKVRDWFAAAEWPARGPEPGPRHWIGPASVGQPTMQTGDTYDAVQGV